MAVEMNLLAHLVDVVETIEQRSATIYLANGEGRIWITDDPAEGVDISDRQSNIADQIPSTTKFFTDAQQKLQLNRSEGWIASRVALDPANPQTSVGVVLQLHAE